MPLSHKSRRRFSRRCRTGHYKRPNLEPELHKEWSSGSDIHRLGNIIFVNCETQHRTLVWDSTYAWEIVPRFSTKIPWKQLRLSTVSVKIEDTVIFRCEWDHLTRLIPRRFEKVYERLKADINFLTGMWKKEWWKGKCELEWNELCWNGSELYKFV